MSVDADYKVKLPGISIVYRPDSDLLMLANDLASDYEAEFYPGCSISFEWETGRVADIVIDLAKEALLPMLLHGGIQRPWTRANEFPAPGIRYSAEDDVLWIHTGFQAVREETPFPGCTVFFHGESPRVSAVRFTGAKELFLPILTGEHGGGHGETPGTRK